MTAEMAVVLDVLEQVAQRDGSDPLQLLLEICAKRQQLQNNP
jgi:hypothetical protein